MLEGHGNWVWALTIDRAEERIISGGHDCSVRAWTFDGKGEILMRTANPIFGVACAPDSTQIAVCTNGGEVLVRKHDGTVTTIFHEDNQAVRAVDFSPCGRYLATGGSDHLVRVWDAFTYALLQKLHGHRNWIWSIHFSKDGRWLTSAGNDGVVQFWSTTDWSSARAIPLGGGWIRSARVDDAGELVVAGCGSGQVQLWNCSSEECIHVWRGYHSAVRALAASSDGEHLVASGGDGVVRIFDTRSGRTLQALERHRDWVWAVAHGPGPRLVASGGNEREVLVWQNDGWNWTSTVLAPHQETVWGVAFSPSGDLVATACEDCYVRVWEWRSRRLVCMQKCSDWALSVRFTSEEALVAGIGSGTVAFIDLAESSILEVSGHSGRVWTVAANPSADVLASGGADGRVLLWSLSGRRVVVECHRHHAPVRSVDISADGHWVASGSEDHTVRIWDRTTSLHRTLRQHRDWVRAVCFLGDGERVASASEDETTVIWSLKEAQPILWIALPHPYQGTSIREVRGLTQAQRSALLALGCNEEPRSLRAISVTEAAGSKIALRQLTREDWHVLRDLRLRALRDAPEAFAQSLAATEALTEMEWRQQAITLTEANYCIALLAFHEQPIGIIEMSVDHLWQNAGYLGGMWVAPEARRTGVGSRLLEKGLEILQQWGLAHVRFCVARHQLHAISLYRRFGFRETGVQKPLPSKHDITVIEMAKALA